MLAEAVNKIGSEEVQRIIEDHCEDAGIQLPETWPQDYKTNVQLNGGITSYSALSKKLCQRISRLINSDESIGEEYGEVFSQVSTKVRLSIVQAMGIESFIQKPHKNLANQSPRMILTNFIKSLKPGQTWTRKAIQNMSNGLGSSFLGLIETKTGPLTPQVIEAILGEEAKTILEKNPFEDKRKRIKTKYDARRYLKEYLRTLDEGEEWDRFDLQSWSANDGVEGKDVWNWYRKRIKKSDESSEQLKKLLGPRGVDLLSRNPYISSRKRLKNWGDVKKVLLLFLETIKPGQTWTLKDLWDWKTKEWNGHTLYKYVLARRRSFTEDDIRLLLGDESSVLEDKRFEKKEYKIKSKEDAKKYLLVFLKNLKSGQSWSYIDLKYCKQIGEEGPKGSALVAWIGKLDENSLRGLLGDCAEDVLRRNPFQRKYVLDSQEKVKHYLLIFLSELVDGEAWSVSDLTSHGEILDGVNGASIQNWILKHCGGPITQKTLESILGEKRYMLAETPFSPRHTPQVTDLKTARRYFLEILTQFPVGESWSPASIKKFGPIAEGKPTGRSVYRWISRHHSDEDNKMTEERIREFLGNQADEILEKHPFQRVVNLTSARIAGYYLSRFINRLPDDQTWSAIDLIHYGEIEDGVLGHAVYYWFQRNEEEGLTKETIKKAIGEQSKILDVNPFQIKHFRGIESVEDCQRYLNSFLQERPERTVWRPEDLKRHGRIGIDGPTGASLYNWLRQNIRYKDEVDWFYILFKLIDQDLLAEHPFKHDKLGHLNIPYQIIPSRRPSTTSRSDRYDTWDPDGRSKLMADPSPNPEEILMMKRELEEKIKLLDPESQRQVELFRSGHEISDKEFKRIVQAIKNVF